MSLCEEFSEKTPKKQKKIKKKSQRTLKSNKPEIPVRIIRRRNNSYPCDKQSAIPLSNSLETLEIHSQKQVECSTLSCVRSSSTRTDLGYSSGRLKTQLHQSIRFFSSRTRRIFFDKL